MFVPTGRSVTADAPDSPEEALRQLGRVVLQDLDAVAERMLTTIVEREPAYARLSRLDLDDLRKTLRSNIEVGVRALAGDVPQDPALRSRATGQLRALQGVPLESALRAYRIGGRVFWEALLTASREHFDGAYDPILLEAAGDVWRLIDNGSAEMASAYRGEARTHGAQRGQAGAFLDALIDGRAHSPEFLRGAADALGFPSGSGMMCLVAPTSSARRPALGEPRDALSAKGIASAWRSRKSELVGLVCLPDQNPGPALELLKPAATGPVGASPVITDLTEVRAAYELAETAARTLSAPGVVTVDERIPEALLLGASDRLVNRLLAAAFSELLALPERDRANLLRTLRALLACNGSATHAARRLHCHRNTVLYRQQRIERLTGRCLGDPRDQLLLTLGSTALQLRARR